MQLRNRWTDRENKGILAKPGSLHQPLFKSGIFKKDSQDLGAVISSCQSTLMRYSVMAYLSVQRCLLVTSAEQFALQLSCKTVVLQISKSKCMTEL